MIQNQYKGGRMVKVKSEVGMTLKLFRDSQFEFIRPTVAIEIEVEKESDIKPQLELAVKALKETWDTTTDQVSELVVAQMPQTSKELELSVSKKLQAFEKELGDIKKLMKK